MDFNRFVSQFVPAQFPTPYREYGLNFIAFVRAYYEFLESEGQVIDQSRKLLSYMDVDTTPDEFLLHFKNKYIASLPQTMLADPRLVIKHILNLYRTKGSDRAYELLFRMLFNEDISVFVPNQYIFKTSNNEWVVTTYIEVSDCPYMSELIGQRITSSSNRANALVEDVFQITNNNKIVNVMTLSSVNGVFKYGEQVYCKNVPDITPDNAPVIFGSLSNIFIKEGGKNFNAGDFLTVNGSGFDGLVRVNSVTSESGTIQFDIEDGGFGFTLQSQISVNGGGGSNASFLIGELSNQRLISVNTDKLSDYWDTPLENANSGFQLSITPPPTIPNFVAGHTVTTSANINILDVTHLSGSFLMGESLSNTLLGIDNLVVTRPDGTLVTVTGANTDLLNANLVPGVVLVSNVTVSKCRVENIVGLQTVTGTGKVVSSNSSSVVVANTTGYFTPFATLKDSNTSANCTILNTIRLTNWDYPATSVSNLDTTLEKLMSFETITVGSILSLKDINPGGGYESNVTVTVIEPLVFDMGLDDGKGGFYGGDAVISSKVNTSNGVITTVTPLHSGWAWQQGEIVTLENANNNSIAVGQVFLDTQGQTFGYWKNTQSFLSSNMYLQDSFYYQLFSNEIQCQIMFDSYQKLVEDLVHPCGIKLFGKYKTYDLQTANNGLFYSTFRSL